MSENDAAADRLERERLRRVPEFRPAFDREYLLLLEVVQAEREAEQHEKRESA